VDEKNENKLLHSEKLPPPWQELPFDTTTNFSLLGWLMDKLSKRKSSKKEVDFTLEE
jgi:hypothetical protein